jgi:PAS domain S-box-containing protein
VTHSPVPVYTTIELFFSNGVVGGNLLEGYSEGEKIALIGKQILGGISPSRIPVVIPDRIRPVYDYNALTRWNVDTTLLPLDCIIRNRPPSFYEKNKALVWEVASVMVLLFVFILVLLMNINKRKHAEGVLKESEKQFRHAVIDSPVPVMIHAEDGEVLQISKTWSELTGYQPEDIPTISQWTRNAYGKEMNVVRADIDKLYEINSKKKDGEYNVTTKDGRKLVWDFNSAPLSKLPDGRRLVISTATDITERKKAEEELEKHRDHLEEMVEEKTGELQKTVNLMAGREIRMIELKDVIKQLQKQLTDAGMKPVAEE